ncbi:UDP-D-apiose/UDP-D-xylose synthase 2 [Orobanche minor]
MTEEIKFTITTTATGETANGRQKRQPKTTTDIIPQNWTEIEDTAGESGGRIIDDEPVDEKTKVRSPTKSTGGQTSGAKSEEIGRERKSISEVKCCSENNKRLIHFSTSEFMENPLVLSCPKIAHYDNQDPNYFLLKEDESPFIFGPVEKQRWSNACAKQLIERLIYAMNFIPGIDGPSEGVLRVIACFSDNLLKREPLKLVDGGQSQRANGHIFNVGNPNNEVTVKKLAEMMTQIYAKVSGEAALDTSTVDVSSKDFHGEEYDDTDMRIPDMTIINRQLGWDPKTSLSDLLESTLAYQHKVYAEANKTATSKPGIKYGVRTNVGRTEEFPITIGVHQGSALSPFLFAIVMDELTRGIQNDVPWCMMMVS